ncbi:MAG: hypothetical protein ACRCX2_13400 [Paraclostridium sp.]
MSITYELFFQIFNTILLILIPIAIYGFIKKNKNIDINKKILNWSIIVSFLTVYILPGQSSDGFAFEYGYPFNFFTIYNTGINEGDTILNSTSFNIGGFAVNVFIIYCIFYILNKFINKKTS